MSGQRDAIVAGETFTNSSITHTNEDMETSMNFEIRPAKTTDADAIVAFNQRIAMETEDKMLDENVLRPGVEKVLSNSSLGFYTVAVSEGKVVGCMMVTYEWSDWRNGVFWWIQSVYVDAKFRRKGVFRAIYEYIRDLGIAQDACGFRLYVERDNAVAQQTYASMGMKETPYRIFEVEC